MNIMLQAALKYFKEYNFCVIPWKNITKEGETKPDKVPIVKWTNYQTRMCTEKEINEWWNKTPDANVGIVTGAISGLMVFDTDDEEADQYFQSLLPDSFLCPIATTPSGGKHYYFKVPDMIIRNAKFIHGKKLDFRGDGGFVGCPPSTNGSGRKYAFLENLSIKDIALPMLPDNLITILKDNSLSLYAEDTNKDVNTLQNLSKSNIILQNGRRGEDLFHTAWCLIKNRTSKEETYQVLRILAKNCIPPFPESEIEDRIKSALDRVARRDRNLAQEILSFINLTKGYINLTEVYNTLQILTKEEKSNVYVIMNRLVKDKIIERFGNKNGQFRKIESEIEHINWFDADEKAHLPIEYPLNLHEYVLTLPKNVVVIAGSKDAGKTTFLLNVACLNRHKIKVNFFSSEMGEVEMKKRLVKMSNRLHISLEDMRNRINWIDRSGDFADVIYPEALNIIDFLEITKDFYEVGDMMKNIYHKLTTGVVVIGIQKPSSRDMPIGGEKGLEKARIAIAIDNGRAKILVGKNWATDYNPRGLECRFKIIDGSEIRIAEPWNKKEAL